MGIHHSFIITSLISPMPTLGSEKLFNFPKVTQTPAPPINSKATAFVILPGSPLPHLQPLAITIALCISVNLTALGISCKWNHTVSVFCNWLVSPSIMSSRFIHVELRDRISFLFKTEWYSIVYIYHILKIHSLVKHLGCFLFLAILWIMLQWRWLQI